MELSRRDLLALGGVTLAGSTLMPAAAPTRTAKRREVIHEVQRYLAKQPDYVRIPSGVYVAVWDGALKNHGPNLGYDDGGRLVAAWLDR